MPIVLGTVVVLVFGLMPQSLMSMMQAAAVPMLTKAIVPISLEVPKDAKPRPPHVVPDGHRS